MKINNINFSQKVANFIEKSPKTQNILQKVSKNPALFNAGYTAILATTFKPVSILLLAIDSDDGRKDAKYGAAKSISTGILDFLVALAIFMPLNKKLNNISNKLFNTNNTIYFKNKEMCANYKSVANRMLKIAALPIFAVLKFGAIEPTIKLIFKKRNDENNSNK